MSRSERIGERDEAIVTALSLNRDALLRLRGFCSRGMEMTRVCGRDFCFRVHDPGDRAGQAVPDDRGHVAGGL